MEGMTDSELLDLNQKGFIPGPIESEEEFRDRIDEVKKRRQSLGEKAIPPAHWEWARLHLKKMFNFEPDSLPAFYSNRSLMPWQGGASWLEKGRLVAVQLRKKGNKDEILAHESVHAARAAFPEDRWEEFFAYMVSEKRWRRVLGPIVQRPWEVWPFLVCCLMGSFFQVAFWGAAIWMGLGFCRLIRGHSILKKAVKNIQKKVGDEGKARAVLVRLTDEEIQIIAQGRPIGDDSLRWRVIRLAYGEEIWQRKSS